MQNQLKNTTISVLIALFWGTYHLTAGAQGMSPPVTYMPPPVMNNTPPPVSGGNKVVNIEIIQRLLAKVGLFKGQPNGVMTDATIEGLRTFAYQQRIAFNGQISDELISSLRRAAWATGGWKKGSLKGEDKLLDSKGIAQAQAYLSKLGYDPGGVDGTFGAQTQSSVETFQASQRITVDGFITKTTLMNLKRAVDNKSIQFIGRVRVLNWPDYIEPAVLEDFERDTKIQVIYDTYGSNEELEEKLKNSAEPYDVAIPTASNIKALVAAGLLKPLDRKQLKNVNNIDSKIAAYLESWDPGATYAVPYMWFTVGVASNKALVSRYAPGVNIDSLSLVFGPAIAGRLSGCGVKVEDSPSDIIPLAALYGGVKNWSNDAKSIAAAEKTLMAVKGIVKPIASDEYIDALAQGKVCAAIGFSGDSIQARFQAGGSSNIHYGVPVEGGSLGFDTLTIPANAKNTQNAIQYIDFILKPQVAAKISNTVHYANANINSGPYMNPGLFNDPGIFIPPQVMKTLIVVPSLSQSTKQDMDRLWKKFSGN